ncbi:uncharacterized protein MONBRDRAFT_32902 [Monosiga brevicollis MX1]|uniref:Ribosomal protein n=1 Tax=Monosiga brevicollis TaxID=81824 RepID=A9V2E7_MONBE|nr:uncharacterized protein MONBRDRAFT_32902 [Monosiga brevicollis MX1]EDQ88244.1 predicted protein [Monosiga brevicollis MX1]|eukprot:XP_001746837.1 hypothetical protein [Monosiga brevicollis MX1]
MMATTTGARLLCGGGSQLRFVVAAAAAGTGRSSLTALAKRPALRSAVLVARAGLATTPRVLSSATATAAEEGQKPPFVVPEDVPAIQFVQQQTEPVFDFESATQVLRALSVNPETIEAHFKVSMRGDKTKKKGRPRDPIRGVLVMPNLFRPLRRVVVFADGEDAQLAREAGAYRVGGPEMLADFERGRIEYDIIMATTSMAREIKREGGRVLRANMPTEKKGTVVDDIAEAVPRVARGVSFRSDAHGAINIPVAKTTMTVEQIEANVVAAMQGLMTYSLGERTKFIEQLYLSAQQTPGMRVTHDPLVAQALE